jgi:hypothetical protein
VKTNDKASMPTKNTVFIHTNAKQIAGAIVSAHSMKRNTKSAHSFDVAILQKEDHAFFRDFEGRKFLRGGGWRTWRNEDLQSFTPTRFMPPELIGYAGRAIVIDPDIFAIGDVNELFERDMLGHAVMAKQRPGHNKQKDYIASSAMLLDCSKLRHWRVAEQFASMFEGKLDYEDWITLKREPKGTIGFLESEWNDFDKLTSATKLLHNTKRNTQPWKSGLPIDYTSRLPFLSKIMPENGIKLWGKYKSHPDKRQQDLFYAFARECMDNGTLTETMVRDEMRANHMRHDSLDLIRSAKSVDGILSAVALSSKAA